MNPWESYQAIYVHIPFCVKKCLYCDFTSYGGPKQETMLKYAAAVVEEIKQTAAGKLGNFSLPMSENATVFFGGGTPSVMPLEGIALIVEALKQYGFWRQPAEATIEVNPGTVNLEQLKAYGKLGFDRISMGVQSLNPRELKAIGRIHSPRQALEAVAWAKKAGFKRISCDLIYGLLGQTMQSLKESLDKLLELELEHISIYGLILEEGTPLFELVEAGKVLLPTEDETADMYDWLQGYMAKQGFYRYEISNYARNNQASRHNDIYWKYYPYLGFGVGATGFDGRKRFTHTAVVEEYLAKLSLEWEAMTPQELLEEFMFMGLRRGAGVDLAEAKLRFSVDVLEHFGQDLDFYLKNEYLCLDKHKNYLRLTEKGMAVGNQIFELFLE